VTKPSLPLWVSALLDKDLSPLERVLLGLLARYQGQNDCAWPSRSMLATALGTSERTVERLIASLVRKGRLAVSRPERQGRGQRNRYTVHPAREGRQSCPPSETSKGDTDVPLRDEKGRQSCRKKGDKPRHVTRVYKEELVNERVNKGRTLKKFTPPTVEEVATYAESIDYLLDAGHFCDYYHANGWRVGKSAMRDWKAAVRNWQRRDAADNGKRQPDEDDDLPTEEELIAKARAGGSKLAWLTGEVSHV